MLLCLAMQQLMAQVKSTSQGSILSASDMHFDPFFDPTLINKLIMSPVGQWQGIFASSAIKTPNSYKHDSNYPLFNSALAAMKRQNPNPAFMVITGDFLCHDFQTNYKTYGKAYPDSMRAFSSKTIQFMALMLDQYFPKTVILPVLGNNDSFCGDYMIDPAGRFLSMFAKAFVPLQRNHNTVADKAFISQFSKGGYYTFNLHDGSGGTMIMMNTIFFSVNYKDTCGSALVNPAGAELDWLAGVFKKHSAQKGKLWLACHIPPGINAYSSAGKCPQGIVTMWRDSCNQAYLSMIRRYAPIIKAGFAGHTHMDDFRVFHNNGKPVSMMHITPAVSPLFSNNPGFQSISYSKTSFGLLNIKTYYLNLSAATSAWALEYDYQKTYRVSNLSPASLDAVRNKISTNPAYLSYYMKYYYVGNEAANGINQQNWKVFWCATGNATTADFSGCYCSAPVK